MTKNAVLRHAANEMNCPKCGGALLAPDHAFDFTEEGLVISLWSCSHCGYRFETDARATTHTPSAGREDAKAEPVPALLVA